MKRKNRIIIGLLAAAAVLFCIIQFRIIPNIQEKQPDYARNQTDALTHDITAIEDYRSAYMGNASNIGDLFEHLPLSDISRKYEIDSDHCMLTVWLLSLRIQFYILPADTQDHFPLTAVQSFHYLICKR